jgi:hypothetical protein
MEVSINSYGALNIAEDINGTEHRRCIMPGDSLIGEPQEVIDMANTAWTSEVLSAYKTLSAQNAWPVMKPSSCSMKQAQLALLKAGLLDQVESLISSISREAQIIWKTSIVVDKHDALVQQLVPALNLTDAQLDDLFALAVTL